MKGGKNRCAVYIKKKDMTKERKIFFSFTKVCKTMVEQWLQKEGSINVEVSSKGVSTSFKLETSQRLRTPIGIFHTMDNGIENLIFYGYILLFCFFIFFFLIWFWVSVLIYDFFFCFLFIF